MGGAGCAVSSACIAWLSLAAALVHVLREPAYAPYRLFSRWQPPRARAIGELLRLGLPMGFSSFVEITAFTLIALLVARLGADVVAGHRIVGNLSALIYMLPLAIAIATLVLVGRAVGARDGRGARHAAKVGIGWQRVCPPWSASSCGCSASPSWRPTPPTPRCSAWPCHW
jgi:MATE family multidrug resistance protein